MSHTSGADDGFGFPGYEPSAPRPTVVQILEGPAAVERRPVMFARPPLHGLQVLRRRRHADAAGCSTDVTGRPFAELMQRRVLDPLGMTEQHLRTAAPPAAGRRARRTHTTDRARTATCRGTSIPSRPRPGCGRRRAISRASSSRCSSAVRGPTGKVLSQASAREMTTPVGIGPYAVGLAMEKRGEGWYFGHGGSNWGFRCALLAPRAEGLRRRRDDQRRRRRRRSSPRSKPVLPPPMGGTRSTSRCCARH